MLLCAAVAYGVLRTSDNPTHTPGSIHGICPWLGMSALEASCSCSRDSSKRCTQYEPDLDLILRRCHLTQVIETKNDSRMKRTRTRPLPSGRISRQEALGWGCASGAAGITVLAYGSNPLTATLGAANLLLYVGPYTLSKPRSELNTWVGSLVGAVPPLMGWAAAMGGVLAVEPLLLATYLFVWQFPHFFSLAWLHREDYARGGFAMVRYVPIGDAVAAAAAVGWWQLEDGEVELSAVLLL